MIFLKSGIKVELLDEEKNLVSGEILDSTHYNYKSQFNVQVGESIKEMEIHYLDEFNYVILEKEICESLAEESCFNLAFSAEFPFDCKPRFINDGAIFLRFYGEKVPNIQEITNYFSNNDKIKPFVVGLGKIFIVTYHKQYRIVVG